MERTKLIVKTRINNKINNCLERMESAEERLVLGLISKPSYERIIRTAELSMLKQRNLLRKLGV